MLVKWHSKRAENKMTIFIIKQKKTYYRFDSLANFGVNFDFIHIEHEIISIFYF